jgi:hypothetical protein
MTADGSAGWFAMDADRPARLVDFERTHRLLLDRMRGIGHPTELSPLAPLFLSRDSYRELFAITQRLVGLASLTLAAIGEDHYSQMRALGADPVYLPAFLPTPDLEQSYASCMVRPDIVLGPDGPRFVELNVGSGFAGVTETHVLHQVFTEVYSDANRWHPQVVDPFAARARLLETVAAERSRERSVVIVGDPAEYDATERMFDLEVQALRKRSFRAAFMRPSDLADLPAAERFSLGIRNFSMVDWVRSGTDPAPIRAVISEGCLLLPSQSGVLLADKRLLALVSEGLVCRSAADWAFTSTYVPWTRIVGDRSVEWRGHRHNLAELIINAKDDLVLKRGIGNSGQEVTIGRDTDEATWRLTAMSAMDGSSVVQEYVPPQPYTLELMGEQGVAESAAVAPVLSPMLMGGRPAGCFARYIRAGTRESAVFCGAAPWNETVAMPLS